jgi:hypothetical protein
LVEWRDGTLAWTDDPISRSPPAALKAAINGISIQFYAFTENLRLRPMLGGFNGIGLQP